jgi:hypothetical protein
VGDWFTFLLLTFVVYRTTHLIVMDTLFEEARDKLLDRITTGTDGMGETRVLHKQIEPEVWTENLALWKRKLFDLLTCPFCFSVWTAAGAVLLHDLFIDPNLPLPVWYWVGLSTSSLIVWAIVDGHD